jgi:hypothetical protein
MPSNVQVASVPNRMLWVGRVISAIPAVLVLFGAVVKLLQLQPVVEAMAQHGIAGHLVVLTGTVELVCAVVYLIPRTAALGAILMTGLLGAATFTNLRVGDPTYVVTVILGVMVWGGLYVRDQRLRELIPLRR